MKKRLHYIQHVPFETPGVILDWAHSRSFEITHTKVFLDEPFPSALDFDFLVLMGGPMSVHDEDQFQWLSEEKAFLRNIIGEDEERIKILGICLGAQLLAEALGAEVYPNHYKEIGWFPVELTPEAKGLRLFRDWPHSLEVFHWHGETFSLPPEAIHLARSEACENQAFLYEDRILALQFHLEVTPDLVAGLLENSAEDLEPGGPYVQDPDTIKGQPELYEFCHELLFKLLDRFIRL
ncbi:glutamine amidotransferase class-I [Thermodesulfatator indicus DSM 15286]|uniref:Glutamine amidotransferase class-I n=1 Tax=Thermodesulfatator indicus (strain DSM 15286 / JCM 11887 / CIR29812) TaxID=667014 RepID=F8ADU4_THEID|nr:type 1 glutamine amidotransferase [Thermodesulfatator indicus]AEH46055.1 glutamine amidotransferase class-I [Thermodesulfatator indicus DSM 15286]